jgi:flagellar basal body-associated protein FliL
MEISEGTSLVGSIQGPGERRRQLSTFGKCMILLLIIVVIVLLLAIVAILILCVGKNWCNYR